MSRTTRYREQHADIAKVVADLEAQLDATKLGADGAPARKLLSSLAGKIAVHLSAEDEHLYPELARSNNEKLKAVASQFAKDMGPIAKAFTGYVAKWPTPTAIKSDPASFIAETKSVLAVLKERIRKENQELYPLADAA